MSLEWVCDDDYTDTLDDVHYIVLYSDGEPVSKDRKILKFSAEAGSSSEDRMKKLIKELMNDGHVVTVREFHMKTTAETSWYTIKIEEDKKVETTEPLESFLEAGGCMCFLKED